MVKLHFACHPDMGKVIDAAAIIIVDAGAKERRGAQAGMARELQQIEQLQSMQRAGQVPSREPRSLSGPADSTVQR